MAGRWTESMVRMSGGRVPEWLAALRPLVARRVGCALCAAGGCDSDLVSVIWKVWYPAMNDASLVRLCFPEPPTPTSRAFPCGNRRILEIRIRWIVASWAKQSASRFSNIAKWKEAPWLPDEQSVSPRRRPGPWLRPSPPRYTAAGKRTAALPERPAMRLAHTPVSIYTNGFRHYKNE